MRASDRAYRTLLTEIQDGLLPAGAVLGEVEQAARHDRNLMPPFLKAVEVYATVGEISDRLREVFGEHRST